MHEMSLAEGVLQIIEEQAEAQRFSRVSVVYLEVGRLAGVELEALRFAFEAVSLDTVAQGARLEIEAVPGRAWCMECAQPVEVDRLYDPCPRCGGYQLQVTGGTEMRVKELAVE